jgi:hypothetical protein
MQHLIQQQQTGGTIGGQMAWEADEEEEEREEEHTRQMDHRNVSKKTPQKTQQKSSDSAAEDDEDEDIDETTLTPEERDERQRRRVYRQSIGETIKSQRRVHTARLQMLQAEEQAARLWERIACADETSKLLRSALLELDIIARRTVETDSALKDELKQLVESIRSAKLEIVSLREIRDQALQDGHELPDTRVEEAEGMLSRARVSADEYRSEVKHAVAAVVRSKRVMYEKRIAEMKVQFDDEIARIAAESSVLFRSKFEDARSRAETAESEGVDGMGYSVISRLQEQAKTSRALREELLSKSKHLGSFITSLRDENNALRHMILEASQRYSESAEACDALQKRLFEAQQNLEDERGLRQTILQQKKDDITASMRGVLATKDREIASARKTLREMQDALQRTARNFGHHA